MQCKLSEAIDKLDEIHGVINVIDDGRNLGTIDLEIVRDLLDDYREILSNVVVKI